MSSWSWMGAGPERVSRVLGAAAGEMPAISIEFPLGVVPEGQSETQPDLTRAIFRIDEARGALILGGTVAQGAKLRILSCSNQTSWPGANGNLAGFVGDAAAGRSALQPHVAQSGDGWPLSRRGGGDPAPAARRAAECGLLYLWRAVAGERHDRASRVDVHGGAAEAGPAHSGVAR